MERKLKERCVSVVCRALVKKWWKEHPYIPIRIKMKDAHIHTLTWMSEREREREREETEWILFLVWVRGWVSSVHQLLMGRIWWAFAMAAFGIHWPFFLLSLILLAESFFLLECSTLHQSQVTLASWSNVTGGLIGTSREVLSKWRGAMPCLPVVVVAMSNVATATIEALHWPLQRLLLLLPRCIRRSGGEGRGGGWGGGKRKSERGGI